MSYRRYLKEIEVRIALNREKGAAELYREALDIVEKWFTHEQKEEDAFIRILSALFKAQPSMAPMLNLVNQLLIAVEEGWDKVERKISALRERHETSLKRIIEHAEKRLNRITYFATVSYSSTIVEAVKSLSARRKLKLIIPEGIPGEHGVRTAKKLKNHAEVVLCSDAFAPSCVKDADTLITGADAITKSHIINGCGTYPMALACKETGIPYVVLADTQKLLPDGLAAYHTIERMTYERDKMAVIHSLFDKTPLSYAAEIITEEGVFTKDAVKEKIEGIRVSPLIKKIAEGGR